MKKEKNILFDILVFLHLLILNHIQETQQSQNLGSKFMLHIMYCTILNEL